MRICRKIAALGLCAVLLVSLISMVFAADTAPVLQFDENGEFKILIVADPQDIDKPQKETIALLEAELDAAQPDLVVFLGDQIHGPSTGKSVERTQKALDAILQPIAERSLQLPSSSATMTMKAASARKPRWNTTRVTPDASRRRAT